MALDPGRVVSHLRELQALTGDADGAQRHETLRIFFFLHQAKINPRK